MVTLVQCAEFQSLSTSTSTSISGANSSVASLSTSVSSAMSGSLSNVNSSVASLSTLTSTALSGATGAVNSSVASLSTSTSTANYTTNPPLTTSAYRGNAVFSPPGSLSSIREPFDPLNRSYASLPGTPNPYVTFAPPNPVINFHP